MDLPCEVIRSSRRTAIVQVYPGGRIVVRVPERYPQYRIDDLLAFRKTWIARKHAELVNLPTTLVSQPTVTKRYRAYALDLFRLRFDRIIAGAAALDHPYRVDVTALDLPALGYSEGRKPELRIRTMRRRWGSCSAAGIITLNTVLADRSPDLIDYVIAHELCHLRELNHSRRFYDLLTTVMPDWKSRRAILNGRGSELLPER